MAYTVRNGKLVKVVKDPASNMAHALRVVAKCEELFGDLVNETDGYTQQQVSEAADAVREEDRLNELMPAQQFGTA